MTIAEIQQEILRMKKEQDICILAHAYQGQEILEVADYTGDSYGLSVQASKRDCSGVIMCGVRFMAETCKILSPDKRVWLANPVAGCPMAEQLDLEGLRELKAQYPDYAVVAYINTTSELKTECDVCVTSSSAVEICKKLEQDRRPGKSGAIVMNANPFTLGHLSLVERAARECDTVHLFVLSEEQSLVPFDVRWKLVTEGVAHLSNVICHPSGPYMISSATFPSYFLKDEQAVITGHAKLDLTLFGSIAQALGVSVRYVGEEPRSLVTGLYNQIMAQELPQMGIQCVEVPRTQADGQVISASAVRQAIHDGCLEEIRNQLPQTTWDFFHSPEAQPVINAIRGSAEVIHY